jgi:LmbE family N-acetylglucosaminyl deacetylase
MRQAAGIMEHTGVAFSVAGVGIMTGFAPEGPVCFVSTHLDDVALSCSHWLAGNPSATVITVFTGAPDIERTDGWNYITTRETAALKAIEIRRKEDAAAMNALGAKACWLDLWDSQYLPDGVQERNAGRDALDVTLEHIRPTSVVAPLGLHHSDHIAVGATCLAKARDSRLTWYYYLDSIRAELPGEGPRTYHRPGRSSKDQALGADALSADQRREGRHGAPVPIPAGPR